MLANETTIGKRASARCRESCSGEAFGFSFEVEKTQMLRRSAFTLVEILIVLAILALLAMILLPVFNMGREGGRRSSCQSNLHQLGLATQQYIEDFNGRYFPTSKTIIQHVPPSNPGCPTEIPHNLAWPIILKDRLHSPSLFECPSLSKYQEAGVEDGSVKLWNHCTGVLPPGGGGGGGGGVTVCPPAPALPVNGSAYSYNIMLGHSIAWENTPDFSPGDGMALSGVKETQCPAPSPKGETYANYQHLGPLSQSRLVDPSSTIFLAETEDSADASQSARTTTIWNDTGLDYPDVRLQAQGKPRPTSDFRLASRHNGGYNVLFADNHVKWIKYGESKPSQWTYKKD